LETVVKKEIVRVASKLQLLRKFIYQYIFLA